VPKNSLKVECVLVQKPIAVPRCKAFGTLIFVHLLVNTIQMPELHVIACLCYVDVYMVKSTSRASPMIIIMITPQLVLNWIICKFSAHALHVNTSDLYTL
jgi:hypothetical protein